MTRLRVRALLEAGAVIVQAGVVALALLHLLAGFPFKQVLMIYQLI